MPIGLSHITIDIPDEAWLSGARTAPKYRRMGVATAITMKCLEYAKGKGVNVARLVTESDNLAAIAAVQKMGFKPVAEFVEMTNENVLSGNDGGKASCWADISQLDITWLICSLQRSTVEQLVYTPFFITGILWIGRIWNALLSREKP